MVSYLEYVVWYFVLTLSGSGLHVVSAIDLHDQKPLLSSDSHDTTQSFALRHFFHHNLEVSDQNAAVFTDVAALPYNEEHWSSQALSQGHAVKVQWPAVTTPPPLDVSRLGVLEVGTASMPVPNITDKETIINLATMTSDVYYLNSSDPGWRNRTDHFGDSLPFGYDDDGLRGHVFANPDNSTVIVAFKGTSTSLFDKTRTKDRENDNILFSCCCAAQVPRWLPPYGSACSCREGTYRCNATCLTSEVSQSDRYYAAATSVVHNVTRDLFPTANVWVIGHSLGGSLASLVGLTFDLPVVTFEAPPERLAARRLGLVPQDSASTVPKSSFPAFHFGNDADPIFQGACNGYSSSCALGGYAFESQCFTGKRCVYEMEREKGWRLYIDHHRIDAVIDEVLTMYDPPDCFDEDPECADCFSWKFD